MKRVIKYGYQDDGEFCIEVMVEGADVKLTTTVFMTRATAQYVAAKMKLGKKGHTATREDPVGVNVEKEWKL